MYYTCITSYFGCETSTNKEVIKLLIAHGSIISQKINMYNNPIVNDYLTDHTIAVTWRDRFDYISHLFTIVVLLCDDHFIINKQLHNYYCADMVRFFTICKLLPMELQMLMCHRMYTAQTRIM